MEGVGWVFDNCSGAIRLLITTYNALFSLKILI